MKNTTESNFPIWDETMNLPSHMIGHAYNSLRIRAIKMETELRAIASNDLTPDRIKINIHNATK